MNGTYLNFMEVKLNKDHFFVKACDYVNKDWYENLQKIYPQYSFVKDNMKSLVYVWAKDFSSTIYLGNNKIKDVEVFVSTNANLIARIVESRINFLFTSANSYSYREKFSSSNIVINKKQLFTNNNDLLINRAISFNISFVKIEDEIRFFIVLDTQITKKFIVKSEDALKKGINIEPKWIQNDRIIANEHSIARYLQNTGLEKAYNQLISKETSEKKSYETIVNTLTFIKNKLENVEIIDFNITFSNVNNLPYSSNFFNCEQLSSPKRFYYDDKEQIDNRYYQNNLIKLKPHSYSRFNKGLSVAVICPNFTKGTTETFLAKLKASLKELMHIPNVDFKLMECKSDRFRDYKEIVDSNINALTNIDLAIVIVSEQMKSLATKDSPYFYCKAKFLGRGISTQEIRIESLKNLNDFILYNITLNIYAKIGGTPWTIETIDSIKDEYIIGITSTIDFNKKKIIGFANVFDYSGTYCTGDCTSLCDAEDYKENFKDVVKKQLQKVVKSGSKSVRLIFHLFKSPSNDKEIVALQEIMNEFKDVDIEYCFVKSSFIHNYRLFENEGTGLVRAGKCVYISNNQALISFTKNIPAHIVIDRRSTFNDLYYICKQMYYFSHLSVRGFKPSHKSVTLLYPQLMMQLLTKLKEIQSWDSDSLKSIEDKLWFV